MVSNLYEDISSMKRELNFAWCKLEDQKDNLENSKMNTNKNTYQYSNYDKDKEEEELQFAMPGIQKQKCAQFGS